MMYCPWTAYVWPPGAATNTGAATANLGRYGTVTPFAGHCNQQAASSSDQSDIQPESLGGAMTRQ